MVATLGARLRGSEAASEIDDDDLPDGRLLWRWVAKATRPVVGWILIGIGGLAILLGYMGVSREALVAKQLPYLISGGIGGMVLVAVGAFFLGTEDLRKELVRLHRLEEMVEQLHETLLVPVGGVEARRVDTAAPAANGSGRLVALAGSNTFHRADCRMVEGKSAQTVAASSVRRRGLEPCRLCEPALADAS
ncbi:MAG TPA: hypothetical protein VM618_09705 [Acidimicrobiia bacterium]|nr:hypothetical protein [Acidimicrobiia bacterium]